MNLKTTPAAAPALAQPRLMQPWNNIDIVFYIVTGGGHTWPGGKAMPAFIVGKTTPDFDATRLMWNFFTEHPLVR